MSRCWVRVFGLCIATPSTENHPDMLKMSSTEQQAKDGKSGDQRIRSGTSSLYHHIKCMWVDKTSFYGLLLEAPGISEGKVARVVVNSIFTRLWPYTARGCKAMVFILSLDVGMAVR